MSLIKCPECGKEISDKSDKCINCGYPLINTICNINGVSYNFSEELYTVTNLPYDTSLKAIGMMRKKTGLSLSDADKLYDIIKETRKIPKEYTPEFPLSEKNKQGYVRSQSASQVTCPYCKSTNVTKISGLSKAGSVALFGIFSQKVRHQWHCNSCKSDF